jgi:poly-gamma-glutamate synthesis protein (capsule biosynthesis protein)
MEYSRKSIGLKIFLFFAAITGVFFFIVGTQKKSEVSNFASVSAIPSEIVKTPASVVTTGEPVVVKNTAVKVENLPVATSSSATSSAIEKRSQKILFVGDMMFDRYIRKVGNEKGQDFIFSCIDELFKSADMVVGNLEGSITDKRSASLESIVGSLNNFMFTFPTSTAQTLLKHNVQIVNLGNNHIGNFGSAAISETWGYLNDVGVHYFGGIGGDEPVYQTDNNISFVSYNEFGGQAIEKVAETIVAEKEKGRMIIVYAHWGDEYNEDVSRLRVVAEKFVENGADIIVGSHPHIVLSHEYVGNVPVYYSLGNFIFDQYFEPRVKKGLAVMFEISSDKIEVTEYPVTINTDGTTCPTTE